VHQYYVYIMASERRIIYVGVTSDLYARVCQHKSKLMPGFTSKYDCTMLVYYETTESIVAAIAREKQLKGWLRKKKLGLIISVNPLWADLSADWSVPSEMVTST